MNLDGPMYYDREGKPMDGVLRWAKLLEDPAYKRVAETTVGKYWVSTVWLGLDHNFGFGGPPLIFETMVFHSGDGSMLGDDEYMERYATEEQALAGHAHIVEMVTVLENTIVVHESTVRKEIEE